MSRGRERSDQGNYSKKFKLIQLKFLLQSEGVKRTHRQHVKLCVKFSAKFTISEGNKISVFNRFSSIIHLAIIKSPGVKRNRN